VTREEARVATRLATTRLRTSAHNQSPPNAAPAWWLSLEREIRMAGDRPPVYDWWRQDGPRSRGVCEATRCDRPWQR